ncbi:hypothetical protein SRHO_G00135360 [Serrasalmus rhombeus]
MGMAQNAMVDQSQLAKTDAMPQPADSVTLLAMSIIGFLVSEKPGTEDLFSIDYVIPLLQPLWSQTDENDAIVALQYVPELAGLLQFKRASWRAERSRVRSEQVEGGREGDIRSAV